MIFWRPDAKSFAIIFFKSDSIIEFESDMTQGRIACLAEKKIFLLKIIQIFIIC